jgi:hypothetical protein
MARSITCFGVLLVFLLKKGEHENRVRVGSVDHSPGLSRIVHSQLVTASSDRRHGSRVGHFEAESPLELSNQEADLASSTLG